MLVPMLVPMEEIINRDKTLSKAVKKVGSRRRFPKEKIVQKENVKKEFSSNSQRMTFCRDFLMRSPV